MKLEIGIAGEVYECSGELWVYGRLSVAGEWSELSYCIFVSVFLEELKEARFPVSKEVVVVTFGPFFAVLTKSKDGILVGESYKLCV